MMQKKSLLNALSISAAFLISIANLISILTNVSHHWIYWQDLIPQILNIFASLATALFIVIDKSLLARIFAPISTLLFAYIWVNTGALPDWLHTYYLPEALVFIPSVLTLVVLYIPARFFRYEGKERDLFPVSYILTWSIVSGIFLTQFLASMNLIRYGYLDKIRFAVLLIATLCLIMSAITLTIRLKTLSIISGIAALPFLIWIAIWTIQGRGQYYNSRTAFRGYDSYSYFFGANLRILFAIAVVFIAILNIVIILISKNPNSVLQLQPTARSITSMNTNIPIVDTPISARPEVASPKSNSAFNAEKLWELRIPGYPDQTINTATLQMWARSGSIKPDSPIIEVDTQRTYLARQIPGLFSDKNYVTALLLSFFLGSLGVDRFYLGQAGLGIAKLFTAGGCGVWSLIDFILIAARQVKDVNGLPLA